MNKNNFNQPDERQKAIQEKAGAFAGFFLMCVVGVVMIYKVIVYETLGWEFWALIGYCVVLAIVNSISNIEAPKNFMGKSLPTGNTKEEKKTRRISYFFDGLAFSLFCTVMDILLFVTDDEMLSDMEFVKELLPNLEGVALIAVTAMFSFVVGLICGYAVSAAFGAFQVRRYNKMLAEFDEE